ncbi:MAG: phage tail protein [Anaerolineae bacterium]
MKQSEIERLLPGIFQRTNAEGTPLRALLLAMEFLHEPDEAILEHEEDYFSPLRAPASFVSFLAWWTDLDRFLTDVTDPLTGKEYRSLPSGVGQLRELILASTDLARWRGTRYGLNRLVELATGMTGFQWIDQIQERPFHLRAIAPAAAKRYETLINVIVRLEKPAYMTFDGVEFA